MPHSLLTLDFPPLFDGGIARWMDELARGLVEAGEEVEIITRGRKAGVAEHDAGYPAPITRLFGHGWVRRHGLYLRLYGPYLGRRVRGRVLHAATWSVLAPLVDRLAREGTRSVCYVHGLELVRGDREAMARMRRTLERASLVIANSKRVAELAEARGAARPLVLAPGVDPQRITPEGPDLRARWEAGQRPLILSLGRLVERKGQDRVLEALPAIRRAIPDVLYIIGGKGPDRDRLQARAAQLELSAHVRFVGFVPEHDLAAAYRSADVYAMIAREDPTDLEGFGITYLEASSAGVAVIGGRSGGVADAIVEGETGHLVDPNDVPALAERLIQLLQDPAERRRLGQAGRARVLGPMSRAHMVRSLLGAISVR